MDTKAHPVQSIPCFGQAVIGHPGAGKTTYCALMLKTLNQLARDTVAVNLDPANETLPYDCVIDVKQVFNVEDSMNEHSLGPNGALLHCMESLERNIEWLISRLKELGPKKYVLFDFPGQIELYIHHKSVHNIMKRLRKLGCQICVVNLVDTQLCSSGQNYISAVMTCLSSMMTLELPQVNVLTKLDLAVKTKTLEYPVSCYEEVTAMLQMVNALEEKGMPFARLTRAFSEIAESHSLVTFYAISYLSCSRIKRLIRGVDIANGYAYSQGASRSGLIFSADELDIDDERDFNPLIEEKQDILPSDEENAFDETIKNSSETVLSKLDSLQRQL